MEHRRLSGLALAAFLGALAACGGTEPDEPLAAAGMASGGSGGASSAAGGGAGGAPVTNGGSGGAGGAIAGTSAAGGGGIAGASGGSGGAASGGSNAAGAGGTSAGGSSAGSGGVAGSAGSGGSGGGGALAPIKLWIAGDSTVANGSTPCPRGWGGVFDPLFNDLVTVQNSAVGGRSVRTWMYEVGTTMEASGECTLGKDAQGNLKLQARWSDMLSGMKPGDYLVIQFGINDASATCDRHVGLAAFKETYGVMAKAAKDRGAQPVFITPVSAIACTGSTPKGTRGGYVTATQEAGEQYDVPVLDLHAASVALYGKLGFCPIPGGDVSASTTGAVGQFFCDDHTHFDTPGATEIAKLVAAELRAKKLPLAAYLK